MSNDEKTYGPRHETEPAPKALPAPELPYRPRDPVSLDHPIGLIGCGGITEYHLQAYRAAGYRVVALCDIHRPNAERRQKEFYPHADIYDDYRDVLRRDDIEVVDIATHPPERPPLIEAALQAGKHVLSQKPFVLDLDVGERLADLADRRGLLLAVNQNGRWAPHFSYMREAVAAGFAVAMRPGDLSFCTYRGHAHTLARGTPVEHVLGELMGRDNGLMRGKGGSMHLTSVEHGVMGSYAIIGAHLPIACGAAWRAQYKGASDVSVCFFGDGTTNIGAFHEALNFAAVWKLPAVFVCENNLYMEYTPIGEVTAVAHPAADRASAYGLEPVIVDGQDADEVYRAAGKALSRARAGEGPSLIECKTYRYSGHSRADPAKYRPEGELEQWKARDPVGLYRARLRQFGVGEAAIAAIDADVRGIVDTATEKCKAAPPPPLDIIATDVYADGGWAWRN